MENNWFNMGTMQYCSLVGVVGRSDVEYSGKYLFYVA